MSILISKLLIMILSRKSKFCTENNLFCIIHINAIRNFVCKRIKSIYFRFYWDSNHEQVILEIGKIMDSR